MAFFSMRMSITYLHVNNKIDVWNGSPDKSMNKVGVKQAEVLQGLIVNEGRECGSKKQANTPA